MSWRDLRELLDQGLAGDLRRVAEPFAPRFEIAAALRQAPLDAPALLFERVAGFPDWRVAGNLIATRRRLALALGVPIERLADYCAERRGQTIEPVAASEVPVQQVVHERDDDLLGALPVLTHHAEDGGPYITIGVVMCRDPVSGERGTGVHRMMVKGGRRLTVMFANPPMSRLHAAAEVRGEALPVVIALGLDPAALVGAVVRAGAQGIDKLGFAGALRGRPIELAPARTVPLDVPARAEIIIEGRVLPGVREAEGPFGENTGTYFSDTSPVIEVSAVTHREQPVYPGLCPGSADVDMLLWLAAGADLLAQLRAQVAGVVDLELARGTAAFSMTIAVTSACSRSEARRLAHLALALDRRLKTITIVNDDIDIRDPDDVAWAVATRWQPARDTVVMEGTDAYVIDPSASGAGQGSKAAFIALRAATGNDARMRLDAAALAKAQALFRQSAI